MVMRNVLLATEAGLGNGENAHLPHPAFFRVKEGVSFNPGDPNYDLYRLAIRTSASASSQFQLVDAPSTSSIIRRATPKPKSPTWAAAPA